MGGQKSLKLKISPPIWLPDEISLFRNFFIFSHLSGPRQRLSYFPFCKTSAVLSHNPASKIFLAPCPMSIFDISWYLLLKRETPWSHKVVVLHFQPHHQFSIRIYKNVCIFVKFFKIRASILGSRSGPIAHGPPWEGHSVQIGPAARPGMFLQLANKTDADAFFNNYRTLRSNDLIVKSHGFCSRAWYMGRKNSIFSRLYSVNFLLSFFFLRFHVLILFLSWSFR